MTSSFASSDIDSIIAFASAIMNESAELDHASSAFNDIPIAAASLLRKSNRIDDAYTLLAAFDLCMMHECDAEICADDDIRECAELRRIYFSH